MRSLDAQRGEVGEARPDFGRFESSPSSEFGTAHLKNADRLMGLDSFHPSARTYPLLVLLSEGTDERCRGTSCAMVALLDPVRGRIP